MEEMQQDDIVPEELVQDKEHTPSMWPKYGGVALAAAIMGLCLYVSGWGGYAFAYVKCGIQRPLIAHSIESSQIYYAPDNRRYSAPGEGVFFKGYYCTESEAQAAGYLRAGP